MEEPLRGEADGAHTNKGSSPILTDLLYLARQWVMFGVVAVV